MKEVKEWRTESVLIWCYGRKQHDVWNI